MKQFRTPGKIIIACLLLISFFNVFAPASIIQAVIPLVVPTGNRTAGATATSRFLICDSSENCTIKGAYTSGSGGGTTGALDLTGATSGNINTLTADTNTPTATNTLPGVTGILPAISGTPTTGNCVQWASAKTLSDTGSPCGSGGGGGGTPSPPYLVISASNYGPFFGPFSTPPAIASLSWINQGGSTATNENGAILLAVPANSGDSLRCLVQNYPGTTPFTFTIGYLPNGQGSNFFLSGIVVTDGTKFTTWGNTFNSGFGAVRQNYNSATSFASAAGSVGWAAGVPMYVTLTDDGTNFTTWISNDPLDLKREQLTQEARNSFLGAPTKIGIFVDANNSGNGTSTLFFHWTGI